MKKEVIASTHWVLLVMLMSCAKTSPNQPDTPRHYEEGSLFTCIAKDLTAGKPLVVTVYVALCDWKHQGVIGVDGSPAANGDDPANNLYWGSWEGFRGYFERKESFWELVRVFPEGDTVLELAVFKKRIAPNERWCDLFGVKDSFDIYLVGLAYRGRYINVVLRDFFRAALTDSGFSIRLTDTTVIEAGGASRIVGYMGHNGLMEITLDSTDLISKGKKQKGVFALACVSSFYFNHLLDYPQINRLALTTQLMGPFAYAASGLVESVILCETREERLMRTARAYDKYQKCGVKAARGIFE